MCQEISLSVHVQELDDVFMTDDTPTTCLRESLGWNDLPFVVCVVVSITSDLLT